MFSPFVAVPIADTLVFIDDRWSLPLRGRKSASNRLCEGRPIDEEPVFRQFVAVFLHPDGAMSDKPE